MKIAQRTFPQLLTVAAVLLAGGCTHRDVAPVPAVDGLTESLQCASLKNVHLAGVDITDATWLPDGSRTNAAGGIVASLPAHCVVHGVIDQRHGVPAPVQSAESTSSPQFNDRYGIHFELRLPQTWARRFLYQGGGGSDGVVIDAVGLIPSLSDSHGYAAALSRGFAVVSSDAGHTDDQNPSFGMDPQARVDYGYASIGRVTPVAKQLIARFYDAAPEHSYFAGCSKGGQEALQAMQRYGDQFDGIVSGDPGLRLPHAAVAEINDVQAVASVAPRDDKGLPDLARSFSDGDLQLVANGVLKLCGGRDGLSDGMIYDPEHCSFDPRVLECKGDKSADCLSAGQVNALHRIFDGAKTSTGQQVYAKWPYDTGIASPGWRLWKLGNAKTRALNATLGVGSMRYVFATPPLVDGDPSTMPISALNQLIAQSNGMYRQAAVQFMDADPVDTDGFRRHGGKLLIYHGTSDPVFSVFDTIDYFKRFQQHDPNDSENTARLFLVPGMNHCSGGDYALDSFDSLQAMVEWVEDGVAPDHLVAEAGRHSGGRLPASMTRPLCAYPETPHYAGSGDSGNAANFVCRREQ